MTRLWKGQMLIGVFQCQWSVKKQLKIWLPYPYPIQQGRALNKYAHGSKVLDRLAAMRKIDA